MSRPSRMSRRRRPTIRRDGRWSARESLRAVLTALRRRSRGVRPIVGGVARYFFRVRPSRRIWHMIFVLTASAILFFGIRMGCALPSFSFNRGACYLTHWNPLCVIRLSLKVYAEVESLGSKATCIPTIRGDFSVSLEVEDAMSSLFTYTKEPHFQSSNLYELVSVR